MRQALPPAAPCPRPRPPQHPLSLHHLRLHQQLILWRWQRAEAVRVGPSGTRCRAAGSGGDARRLNDAASQYIEGLKAGVDEDDLVAQELGVPKAAELSDLQQRYKDQIKAKLAQVTPVHLFRKRRIAWIPLLAPSLDPSVGTVPMKDGDGWRGCLHIRHLHMRANCNLWCHQAQAQAVLYGGTLWRRPGEN